MSENFIVSARKYRPNNFESVVGQSSITTTLKNAIKTQQLAHAYLFCGPRGVGKTTCARIFAKTINCQNLTSENEACNECQSCTAFNANRSMNIHELDAASNNSVEDIRKLIEQVRISPQIGQYSVYIIDEVHMLSTQAFNAFLKTLEEPPKHAIFILATTEKHKILATILSRCQIFDFNRIQVKDIIHHLQYISDHQEIKADPNALSVIAQKADGALRDALSFFDQIASFADKNITYEKVIQTLNVLDYDYYFKLVNSFMAGQYTETLVVFDEILNNGFDAHNFIVGLSEHLRDVLVSKDENTIKLLDVGENIKKQYLEQSKTCSIQFLLKALDIISTADVQYKMSKNKRLHVELMLLKLSQITQKLESQEMQFQAQQNQPLQQQQPIKQQVRTVVEQVQSQAQQPQAEPQQKTVETPQPKTETVKKEETPVKNALPGVLPSLSMIGNVSTPQKETKQAPPAEQPLHKGTNIVNVEQIKTVWLEYANTVKALSPRLASTLTQYEFELQEQTIVFNLSNETQIQQIKNKQNEILNFLNKKLNSNLSLDIKLSKTPLKSKNPYTKEEKYEFLKSKNENLDVFKQKFKLSLE